MENRAERSGLTYLKWLTLRLVIVGAGALTTYQGYEGERNFNAAIERGFKDYCGKIIASIPQRPDRIVTAETWQSCREVYLQQTDQSDRITNYVAMFGGGLAAVYGLAKLLSGLPFLPRGRGRFNLS